jgi:hypothetical protein
LREKLGVDVLRVGLAEARDCAIWRFKPNVGPRRVVLRSEVVH